jgi:O-6-methylguanine DNA methyltransferase
MVASSDDRSLHALAFADQTSARQMQGTFYTKLYSQLEQELEAYFKGEAIAFTIPVVLLGTPFQMRVWEQLLCIPYGQTRSYQDVARAIGQPGAVRAVGSACGANPIALLIPCHRVIKTGGIPGNYAGGADRKEHLLAHESRFLLQ